MYTPQGKRRLPVMVEQSWFPIHAVMTTSAVRASDLGKLRPMGIHVAGFTPRGFRFELRDAESGASL
jgi:hypothetical protein